MDAQFNSSAEINLEYFANIVESIQEGRNSAAFLIIGENKHAVTDLKGFKGDKIPEGFRRIYLEEASSIAEAILKQFSLDNVLQKVPDLKVFTWHKAISTIQNYFANRLDEFDASQKEIAGSLTERAKHAAAVATSTIPLVGKAFVNVAKKGAEAFGKLKGKIISEDLNKNKETTQRIADDKILDISQKALFIAERLKQEIVKAERLYFNAIRNGSADDIKHLMQLGIHPESSQGIYTRGVIKKGDEDDGRSFSPMQYAAAYGNKAVIEQLLTRAEDVTRYIHDPLQKKEAIFNARRSFLEEIDQAGNNLLHYAVEAGNKEMFVYLMEELAKSNLELINAKNTKEVTPLQLAVIKKDNSIINELFGVTGRFSLAKGLFKISPNEIDSLLNLAFENENLAAAALISQYASEGEKDKQLDKAVKEGKADAVSFLLERRCSIKAIDNQLIHATRHNPELFEIILPYAKPGYGADEAFKIAVELKNIKFFEALFPLASPDAWDAALLIAVNNKNIAAIRALLPDIRRENPKLKALEEAARIGSATIVNILTHPPHGIVLGNDLAKKLAYTAVQHGGTSLESRKEAINKFIHSITDKNKDKSLFLNSLVTACAYTKGNIELTEFLSSVYNVQIEPQGFSKIAEIIVQDKANRNDLIKRYIPLIKKQELERFFISLVEVSGKYGDIEFTDHLKGQYKARMIPGSVINAIKGGHLDYIKKYLSLQEGIPDGFTATHQAVVSGHLDILKSLLGHYKGVNLYMLLEEAVLNAKVDQLKMSEFLLGSYIREGRKESEGQITTLYMRLASNPTLENYDLQVLLWDAIPARHEQLKEKRFNSPSPWFVPPTRAQTANGTYLENLMRFYARLSTFPTSQNYVVRKEVWNAIPPAQQEKLGEQGIKPPMES